MTRRNFSEGASGWGELYNSGRAFARFGVHPVPPAFAIAQHYTYDGLERLAIRTTQNMTPAGTTHYVYDLAGHLIAESTDTGTTVREYVWLDDMPLAVVADVDTSSPNLYYVHADHLNRPIKMTDGSGTVVWDAVYWPFGEVSSITGSASNNLRFPGQYFLIESGLHYNWYRHYDPSLGRFTQPDPLGLIAGPSVYAYANSDPLQMVDPNGQFGILGGIGSAATDIVIQLARNYENTGDVWTDIMAAAGCVNITEVAIAGMAGIVFPTFTNVAYQGWQAYRAGAITGGLVAAASGFAQSVAFREAADFLSEHSLPVPIVPPPLTLSPNCGCK